MKIGVLYNCQHRGLAASLRQLRPDAEVVSHELITAKSNPDAAARIGADLASCDAVVSNGPAAIWGELSAERLNQTTRRHVTVPPVIFAGFHPDAITIHTPSGELRSPTAMIHSRLGVAAYLAGLTPEAAAPLYNRLIFNRLGYLNGLARPLALITHRFASAGIAIGPTLAAWQATGCFMHSVIHPKIHVVADLARIACGKLGLPTAPGAVELPADDLACHATHPLFPAIAASLGLPPEEGFKPFHAPGTAPAHLSAEEFLAGCFAIYGSTPGAVLLAADGVAQARGRLGG